MQDITWIIRAGRGDVWTTFEDVYKLCEPQGERHLNNMREMGHDSCVCESPPLSCN